MNISLPAKHAVAHSSVDQLQSLAPLVEQLKRCSCWKERRELLYEDICVQKFLLSAGMVQTFLQTAGVEAQTTLCALVAIGQQQVFSCPAGKCPADWRERLQLLVQQLTQVEKFYWEAGGIVGYHLTLMKLLIGHGSSTEEVVYHPPQSVDISVETDDVRAAIRHGIASLPRMAEVYPLGGAADRLRLYDERTGLPLPAAKLRFEGRTLLERLISDLQAREHLYYQLTGEEICTPIAMMTSMEKDNHAHILNILEEHQWFHRPKESFRLFCQPLVPTVNYQGAWCCCGPMRLLMKPGGHGAMWKLARDEGIFSWLRNMGREKILVRQINNLVAGVDYGLLAFAGLGFQQRKMFGFASCPRLVKASEGMNVVIERASSRGVSYTLTNIEYCDFKRRNIPDEPTEAAGAYSRFSSNTNILFADLHALEKASIACPLPGLLINLKKTSYRHESGRMYEDTLARLESTMQNIADQFEDLRPAPLPGIQKQSSLAFLTHNKRYKTISTVKRECTLGASFLETPEGCFLDLLRNGRELLESHCGMEVPDWNEVHPSLAARPPFLFSYHPALGPIYSLIGQKIRGGRIGQWAELRLEIAHLYMEEVDIEGSLCISAELVMSGAAIRPGRCRLIRVQVRNEGIDRDGYHVYWRGEIQRKETCRITLEGDGEFAAEDVVLSGDLSIHVPTGKRVTMRCVAGQVCLFEEEIETPSWRWNLGFADHDRIIATMEPGARTRDSYCL